MTATFVQSLPVAVFLLVPFFAVLLRLAYRNLEPYYVPHLVFALHFHSALFLLLTLGELGDAITAQRVPGSPAGLVLVVFLYLSLRRVYGESRFRTVMKEVVLLAVHLVATSVVLAAAFLLTGLLI